MPKNLHISLPSRGWFQVSQELLQWLGQYSHCGSRESRAFRKPCIDLGYPWSTVSHTWENVGFLHPIIRGLFYHKDSQRRLVVWEQRRTCQKQKICGNVVPIRRMLDPGGPSFTSKTALWCSHTIPTMSSDLLGKLLRVHASACNQSLDVETKPAQAKAAGAC